MKREQSVMVVRDNFNGSCSYGRLRSYRSCFYLNHANYETLWLNCHLRHPCHMVTWKSYFLDLGLLTWLVWDVILLANTFRVDVILLANTFRVFLEYQLIKLTVCFYPSDKEDKRFQVLRAFINDDIDINKIKSVLFNQKYTVSTVVVQYSKTSVLI